MSTLTPTLKPRQIQHLAKRLVREIVEAEFATGSVNEGKIASTILGYSEGEDVDRLEASLKDDDVIAIEREMARVIDRLVWGRRRRSALTADPQPAPTTGRE